MTKAISISLSPNTERDDVSLAFGLMFKPWDWVRGNSVRKFERNFRNYFGFKNSFAFNSGRSSMIAILDAMKIGEGDEVIVQGYTCNAAINPIIYVEAKPVFADIDDNLNISPREIEKKITSKTKAVVIQHTFGYPADIDEIKSICKKHNLYLIEDCAHALGAKYKGEFCGSFGDASFFSFGRDKVISSVYGGMVVVNNDSLTEGVSKFSDNLRYPGAFWVLQQLLHPVLMNAIVLPFYNYKWGRGWLALFLNMNILSKAVTAQENHGQLPDYFPLKMPNALAIIALHQLKKLDRFNAHRKEIARFYPKLLKKEHDIQIVFKKNENKDPIFLKYPVLSSNSNSLLRKMRDSGIYLNDGWRDSVVVPPKTNLRSVCYTHGDCPKAEEVAKRIICLPTHINISRNDVDRIIKAL